MARSKAYKRLKVRLATLFLALASCYVALEFRVIHLPYGSLAKTIPSEGREHLEWKVRTERELKYFKERTSRHAIWNTATYLLPWSLVLHISSAHEIWIPPQPDTSQLDSVKAAYYQYALGSLVTLQMLMHHSDVLPDVTVVLFFTPNCLYTLSDSVLMTHFHTGPLDSIAPAWRAWLADDEKPNDMGGVPPLNVSIAPALHYQSSSWNPSSLDCRGVAFPLYDWVWRGEDFSNGSTSRMDGLAVVPWESRKSILVFRGSIKADSIPFADNSDLNSIRGRAATLSLQNADIVDIKLTSPSCRDPDPPNCKHPGLSSELFDSSPQRHLTKEQQFEYKYQIDIDGHGGTFRFKHLMLSGSLVFKVDSPLNQFWMPHLRPWVHYIPVSWRNFETDLILKLRWARGHDAEAKRIMLAGHQFVSDFLNDKTVTQYQQQVLMQLAELQTPPLPRLPNSVKFCCSLIPDDKKWAHWRQKCEQYENPSCTTSPAVDIFQLLS